MKLFHYFDNNPRNINLLPGFKRVEELLTLAAELITAVLEDRLKWEGEMLDRLLGIVRDAGNAEFLAAAWVSNSFLFLPFTSSLSFPPFPFSYCIFFFFFFF